MRFRSVHLRSLLLAVLGAAALALPACGGDDGGENVIAPSRNRGADTAPSTPTTPTTTQAQPGQQQPGGGQQGTDTSGQNPGGGSAPPPADPYQGGVDPGSGQTPGERFENYCRQHPDACGN